MAPRLADLASEMESVIDPQDAVAEANHRIANNLTIVAEYVRSELSSLSQEKIPDFLSIRRSLQQLSVKIDAIGRLHRLLTRASQPAHIEICAYLREVADAARCSLVHAGRVQFVFSLDSEALVTAKQAVAIGAVASEALINSIKYAHPGDEPGVVSISCRPLTCGGLVIEIKDDGVGRGQGLPSKGMKYGGAGTDLMRALAYSVNASLEVADGDPGHIVRLKLPPGQLP